MQLLENVLLSEIYPDPNNPRKDFGDLDALADSFDLNKANPGEPVNPIVTVADGARYRIVDGERRYRAMAKRGKLACCAIVCEDYSEAEAVIQMLATNLKMELSEEERSRGFQLSLRLGCDDAAAERAAGLGSGAAARVRRAQAAIADPDRCEQLTIDRLEAIAEFADDEDAVEQIASASGGSWLRVRDSLRREAERRSAADRMREAADAAGIELLDRRPGDFAGFVRCGVCCDPGSLAEVAGSAPEGALAMLDEGTEWRNPMVVFWCDPSDAVEDEEKRAEREFDEEVGRAAEAFDGCIDAHFAYVAGLIGSVGFEKARTQFPATWALVLELAIDGKGYDPSGIRDMSKRIMAFNEHAGSDLDVEWTASLFCSSLLALYPDIDRYEVKYALAAERGSIEDLDHYLPDGIRKGLRFADAFRADGFQVPEEEQRVYEGWEKFVDAYERKEG